jgi:arabinogalactan endo-1,4-beta-galactosidase
MCDAGGLPIGNAVVNGSTAKLGNLASLLRAGLEAVKEVDPKILTSCISTKAETSTPASTFSGTQSSRGSSSMSLPTTAYVRWQGQPNQWRKYVYAAAADVPRPAVHHSGVRQ